MLSASMAWRCAAAAAAAPYLLCCNAIFGIEDRPLLNDTGGSRGDGGGAAGAASQAGAGGAGGGAPRDCWDHDVNTWSLETLDLSRLQGGMPGNPRLSADGLTLTYSAMGSGPNRRIWLATRPTRDEPFAGGRELEAWPSVIDDLSMGSFAGDELWLNVEKPCFEIAYSVRSGDGWGSPMPAAAPVNTPECERLPSVAAGGSRMIFTHDVGTLEGISLFEATRSDATPGAAFDSVEELVIAGVNQAEELVACGALAPDGLRLFFSATMGEDLSMGLPAGALDVYFMNRPTLSSPWEAPQRIETFSDSFLQGCVHSVTTDGCEVLLERFELGVGATWYFARRTPTL